MHIRVQLKGILLRENKQKNVLYFVLASLEELQSVMESLGDKVTKKDAEEMIKQADVDGDGKVDYIGTKCKFVKENAYYFFK